MTYLFVDTETTGFPKNGAAVQEGQARVCQIAMLLTDSEGAPLAEFCSLITPQGWTIGEGAKAAHGFSDDHCKTYGLPSQNVMMIYCLMAEKAEQIIAHNSDFDERMIAIEWGYNQASDGQIPRTFPERPWLCTMKPNTNVVKAPHKNGGAGYKWPTLNETLRHFCGRELGEYAHDAMYDVKACRDIFFAMKAQKQAA